MKSGILEQIIIVVLIFLTLLGLYFGSYLPFVKGQKYIFFANSIGSIKTLEQFKVLTNDLLSFHSPVGQEESVRFLSQDILNLMSVQNQPEEVVRDLAGIIEGNILKDNVRHLLNGASAYSVLWNRYKKPEDFLKIEDYMQKTLAIGPNLPPALYPLFDLYRIQGNQEKMREIGEIILKNWPEDEKIRTILGK